MKSLLLVFATVLSSLMCPASVFAGPNEQALYLAVLSQDVEAAKASLAKGADANYRERGRPLLGWAAQTGSSQIVDILLKGGANPNLADEGISGHTPLMRAIETQQPGAILLLLKAKADPNAVSGDGKTVLMMAVESRKPKVVQALIISGANLKYVSPEGDSPVLSAAQDGSDEGMEIIRILGKAGAEMNASNAAYTPLLYAIGQSNVKLVTVLLEAGADPNGADKSGTRPLFGALGNPEIFQLLLKAKADPNAVNGRGETPLAEAIYNNQIEYVKMLLDAGADRAKGGMGGKSALEYAQDQYRTEIVALLNPTEHTPGSNWADTPIEVKPAAEGECNVVEAARMQMDLHGKLMTQVEAGKIDRDIFRTFGDDTKDYADMLARNPNEACQLFQRLAKKYGVEAPTGK